MIHFDLVSKKKVQIIKVWNVFTGIIKFKVGAVFFLYFYILVSLRFNNFQNITDSAKLYLQMRYDYLHNVKLFSKIITCSVTVPRVFVIKGGEERVYMWVCVDKPSWMYSTLFITHKFITSYSVLRLYTVILLQPFKTYFQNSKEIYNNYFIHIF